MSDEERDRAVALQRQQRVQHAEHAIHALRAMIAVGWDSMDVRDAIEDMRRCIEENSR